MFFYIYIYGYELHSQFHSDLIGINIKAIYLIYLQITF